MKVPGKLKSYDGTRISYRVWGKPSERTPVVCCSGIACDDVYWTYLAPELSKERQVVTWDYPWHGDSGPPGDRREISVPSLARHAHALFERTGLPPAVFVGHSMGVQVILECFRLFPDEVAALISIAGPYAHTVGHLYGTNLGHYLLTALEAAAKGQPEITTLLWRLAVTPQVADPLGRASGLIGRAPPELMARYFRHLATLDPAGLFEMFRAGHDHSADDVLEKIDVPVLIVHGSSDVMSPFRLAQEMAERIPGAELVRVEGGAHTLPIEDPGAINGAIRRFLEEKVDA